MKITILLCVLLFTFQTYASERDDYGMSVVAVADEMWQRIETIIDRTDSELRSELEQVFYSGNASCDFIEEWFDTWNRIADQEALVYERSKKLRDDLLVMKLKMKDPTLKQTLDKILEVIKFKVTESIKVLNYISDTRLMVEDSLRYRC